MGDLPLHASAQVTARFVKGLPPTPPLPSPWCLFLSWERVHFGSQKPGAGKKGSGGLSWWPAWALSQSHIGQLGDLETPCLRLLGQPLCPWQSEQRREISKVISRFLRITCQDVWWPGKGTLRAVREKAPGSPESPGLQDTLMLLGAGGWLAADAGNAARNRNQNCQLPWPGKGFFHLSFGKCCVAEKAVCVVPGSASARLCPGSLNNRCPQGSQHVGDPQAGEL